MWTLSHVGWLIKQAWPPLLALSGIIAGIVIFIRNVLTVKKLRLEVAKLENEKDKKNKKIITPNSSEIEHYGRSITHLKKWNTAITLMIVLPVSSLLYYHNPMVHKQMKANTVESVEGAVEGKINVKPTIDYKELEKDEPLKTLMENRKTDLGIQKSLDMIIKSDESFIVGASKVSMREILEKAFTQSGEVYQEDISSTGESLPKKIKEYGIYVVRPGDNIWNIHFNILKEYYSHKNIQVASKADEPGNLGFSSGVGKILKFSETMVIIYNLLEEKVTHDLNLIEPLSKVVVYNMEAVFNLLDEINYTNVDKLQFDGKNIWIPATD